MTLPILIRMAKPVEHTALQTLRVRASLANASDRDNLINALSEIKLPIEQIFAGQVFIAELNSRVLGFSVILPSGDEKIMLDGLFVEPDFWKHGIGRVLVQHASEFAKSSGFRKLHVIGNLNVEHFYKLYGFKTTEIIKTRFGCGLLMHKDL